MKNKLYILLFLAFLFSGTALWAQQKATPKAGEGISAFLLRHNRSPQKYMDDFIELNKKKLGKKNVLKVGVSYIIPPKEKSKNTNLGTTITVSYTHLRAHETTLHLVCRLLLEKK